MKKLTALLIVAFLVVLAWETQAQFRGRPSHMDAMKNPRKCEACHGGRGVAGSPMLRMSVPDLCFSCHGTFSGRRVGADVEAVFSKISKHPIYETAKYHSPGEVLPERLSSAPRHVSCSDCHLVHLTEQERPWAGARGYKPGQLRPVGTGAIPPGVRVARAEAEYELCYLCHAESANLPLDSRNIAAELNPANASFHPVETVGRNRNVPSLVRDLSVNSTISCSSCHGNNEPGGPRGPHGSDYSPILVARYRTQDGPEDPKDYELCYMCHDRRSVLGDESFNRHNLHIVKAETSCHTCHASHGAELNTSLIEFNPSVVSASATSGGPQFIKSVGGSPRCYLNCHGVDHNINDAGGTPWPL